jgi:crossover junction endodeoxyribonuclease RuvC
LGGRADKRSAATAFQAGCNWGIAYGVTAAQYVPLEMVAPAHWKRDMRVSAAKDSSLARIKQILPQHAGFFARQKDEGRAEAALIALYAERRFRSRAVTP